MKFNNNFYKEVKNRLSEELIEFWGKKNILHFALNMNFPQFIKWSIDTVFEKIEEDKLVDDIPRIREAYRKKRRDWSKRYCDLLKLQYHDKLHPLYSNYLNIKKASPLELILQYQDMPIEEIMNMEKEKLTLNIEEWKKSKTMPLIAFPCMDILSESMIENALRDDIVKVACDYIVKELKYNFEQEAKLLPSPIVDKPLFGINSVNIPLEEIDGVIQSVIKNQNDGSTLTMIPKTTSSDTQIKSLNKKDLAVYKEITKLASSSGIVKNGKISIEINPYSVASSIWGYHINSEDAQAVLNSINNLANRRFLYTTKDGQSVNYVLIDTIIQNNDYENGMPHPYITLGSTISEAILQKDIIGVSKKLEDKVIKNGKAFLHALQAKRFETFRDSPETMEVSLTLHFFEKSAFFSTKSFKKKIAIVMECLDSYVSSEVLIKNYSFQNDIFTIAFFTLDEDDMKYYSDWVLNHKAIS